MSAPISELPTRSQEMLLQELAKSAIALISNHETWRVNGIDRSELLDRLLDESPRSSREIMFGVQFALSRGLLKTTDEMVFLPHDHSVIS